MTGTYGTRVTTLPQRQLTQRSGKVGQTGITTNLTVLPGGSKTTYSYRTVRGSDATEVELADARRIFRNGFSTNDPVYDRGHEFYTRETSVTCDLSEFYISGIHRDTGDMQFYRGPLIPQTNDSTSHAFPSFSTLSNSEVVGFGQRALLKSAPTSPQAAAATFIGELHQGLPNLIGSHLWKSKVSDYRAIGGEYLNVQFGWLPFISDLRKQASSLKKATKYLRQLQRDNGRVVRRSFSFPMEVTNDSSSVSTTNGPWFGNNTINSIYPPARSLPAVTRRKWTERSTWFSGAFSYMIPQDSTLWARLERYDAYANVLLGTRVTPEVLWELAPWSWLVDWKFGIGQMLSLATRFSEDGLVVRYGYLMCHTVTYDRYSAVGSTSGSISIPAREITFKSESKYRYRSTPYGFGLNPAEFTPQKWAILGALGMTKGPTRLA